jgi:alkylhydroperoxidase/carboxymuconolactone decarboxylase family protein YurZ
MAHKINTIQSFGQSIRLPPEPFINRAFMSPQCASDPTSVSSSHPTPVCDTMRALGEWNPLWNEFAELDTAWTEKFMSMATTPMLSGVLDAKTIEFIAIAVDASCTHMYGPGVRRHIRKALELGATSEQIVAVLQLTSVLGIHTMSLGAPILKEELARAKAGRAVGAGADSQPDAA